MVAAIVVRRCEGLKGADRQSPAGDNDEGDERRNDVTGEVQQVGREAYGAAAQGASQRSIAGGISGKNGADYGETHLLPTSFDRVAS